MNLKEREKIDREREIFEEFASTSGLGVESSSVRNEPPPGLPDISCDIKGLRHYFELSEITDRDLARNYSLHQNDDRSFGGAISHSDPLLHVFRRKATKRYAGIDGPLDLVVYYDNQVAPYFDLTFIPANVGLIATRMLTSGNWNRVWVFDRSQKRILWKHEIK